MDGLQVPHGANGRLQSMLQRPFGAGGADAGYRAAGHELRAGLALGIVGILTYLAIHNLFDDLYVHGMTAQLALLLGMLTEVEQREKGELSDV